jgi:hypothetical protein
MNAAPTAAPHAWSDDAFLAKAQLYFEQMHNHAHDDWKFVLWSTLALEFLARAALARISPTLLADAKDWNNILYALEQQPRAQRFVPKSVNLSVVIDRLMETIPNFDPELAGIAKVHIARRNEELHSGNNSLYGLGTSAWLPDFYRCSKVLLQSMGEDLKTCLNRGATQSAEQMIAASVDQSANAVRQDIEAHKAQWLQVQDDEKQQLISRASTWATRQTGHRVKCPACNCDALVVGLPVAPPIKTIQGDEITELQQYLPSKFECISCGLKISGLPRLNASGLGDAYTATQIYDAAEFYADELIGGYEPDYND